MSAPQFVIDPQCHGRAAREAAVLRAILWDDPRRRRIWQRRIRRQGDGSQIHQAAVARVLAQWLYDAGEASENDEQLPRRLKDAVSRALSGKVRLPALLKEAVLEAFEVDDATAVLLWDPPEVGRAA
ncbi:hypothetical protein [Ornithinimicrobium avium]|uniref:Uncharacterized protein n=1 Tax=Ornithinimicrobium avium TaxID=2283195 RepID=A0A345NK96_9MICO|nr:hypothetical protein [Ornithinimicrobium avium]AXH95454.1 hypothetical protein DV701_04310 [Ornithinimicrobium avium]